MTRQQASCHGDDGRVEVLFVPEKRWVGVALCDRGLKVLVGV